MLVEDDKSTRNGLIRALDTTRSLALSGSAGATVQDSHREHLEQMRPGEARDRLHALFADL